MSNTSFPNHWSSWAIIGAIIFLILLATHHTATAFAGLVFVGFIFVIVLLANANFSSQTLWIALAILVALLLILGLGYVPSEWKPQQSVTATSQLLPTLFLIRSYL
jgi:membrane protein implicated in regulation of membrane protease activity